MVITIMIITTKTNAIKRLIIIIFFDTITQIQLAVLGTVALSCVVLPWMILPVFVLWVMMEAVRRYTVHTTREMKRNECIGMFN